MAELLVLAICGPILAVPYLALLAGIALVAPSWRWVAGFIVLVLGALALMWAWHWIETSRPGYNQGLAGALGLVFVTFMTTSVIFGSAMYAGAVLWMNARRRQEVRSGDQ